MGGRTQHRCPVRSRRLDDDSPGLAERLARLGHRLAYPGVGLDLGAKRLPRDLVRPDSGLAGFENARVGIGEEIARFRVDEKELLLHPEGYIQVFSILGIAHDVLLLAGGAGRRAEIRRSFFIFLIQRKLNY